MNKRITALAGASALCALMLSAVADAQTIIKRENCNWFNTWLPSPSSCPQNKYDYAKFGYNFADNGTRVEARWNYYAGCPECTGQGDLPRWRREYTKVGSTTIVGVGVWHGSDRTSQSGFNFYNKNVRGVTAVTKICYEATSQNSFFCESGWVTLN